LAAQAQKQTKHTLSVNNKTLCHTCFVFFNSLIYYLSDCLHYSSMNNVHPTSRSPGLEVAYTQVPG